MGYGRRFQEVIEITYLIRPLIEDDDLEFVTIKKRLDDYGYTVWEREEKFYMSM